jgi:hypothetical protein
MRVLSPAGFEWDGSRAGLFVRKIFSKPSRLSSGLGLVRGGGSDI